jgi:hypothetical protein
MEALSASVCFSKQERLEQFRFSSIPAIHLGLRSPLDHEGRRRGRLGIRKAEQAHKRVCSDAHFLPVMAGKLSKTSSDFCEVPVVKLE